MGFKHGLPDDTNKSPSAAYPRVYINQESSEASGREREERVINSYLFTIHWFLPLTG